MCLWTETPKAHSSSSSKSTKSSSRPSSRRETPRNSPTPTSSRVGKKDSASSRDVTPKSQGQKVTPKHRGQADKDSTPRSWDNASLKLKRSSSSTSRLSTDGGDGWSFFNFFMALVVVLSLKCCPKMVDARVECGQ